MNDVKAKKATVAGPYFVVGTNVYLHWPDSKDGNLCDGEKQYGPDFAGDYTTVKAARKDAEAMNKAWVAKQATVKPVVAQLPDASGEAACSDAAYEAHLDAKAAKDVDPREEGWL